MYQVPGMDIVFACIMCALLMLLCYIIGRTYTLKGIEHDMACFKANRTYLCKELREQETAYLKLQELLEKQRIDYDFCADMDAEAWRITMAGQKRELIKKHRAAMKAYRAKCDRQVVHHMETYNANQIITVSEYSKPDFSELLSK